MKLDFDDFDLEESENCKYDSLTVFGDIDGKDEIGKVFDILKLKHKYTLPFKYCTVKNTVKQ